MQLQKDECPLNGQCLAQDIVYKCIVSTSMTKPILEWLKEILRKDTTSTQIHLDTSCTQRKHYYLSIFGKLKRSIIKCQLQNGLVKSVPSYSNISKKCLLCLHEKLESVNFEDQDQLLNKRSELISKCRHANKYLLCNYKAND